jgi:hypothetical protein
VVSKAANGTGRSEDDGVDGSQSRSRGNISVVVSGGWLLVWCLLLKLWWLDTPIVVISSHRTAPPNATASPTVARGAVDVKSSNPFNSRGMLVQLVGCYPMRFH